MSIPTPRDLATIEKAVRREMATRGTARAGRNRRNADMLRALADVEQFEREMAACDERIETLFEERDRARLHQLADSLVRES